MKKKLLYLWIVIFILNTIDMGCTLYGLQVGAITEGNPLMLFFLEERGVAEALLFKYAAVVALLPLVLFVPRATKLIYALVWTAVGVLGFITLMHVHWIFLFFT